MDGDKSKSREGRVGCGYLIVLTLLGIAAALCVSMVFQAGSRLLLIAHFLFDPRLADEERGYILVSSVHLIGIVILFVSIPLFVVFSKAERSDFNFKCVMIASMILVIGGLIAQKIVEYKLDLWP